MAPARIEEDPVIAEYDVFLTPDLQEQVYLLQYLNRSRDRPYNSRLGARPEALRIKPTSGHIEVDVNLNVEHNFNKFQGLKWGDAIRTGKELQNDNATFGLANGFSGPVRANAAGRAKLKDPSDRELDLQNEMGSFAQAAKDKKVLQTQTLGGQLIRHDSRHEAGKPLYFAGAFRGSELHLSRITGTAQMRPQFHHIDAEDQRNRLATSREHASAAEEGAPRALHQSYKPTSANNPKGELEARENEMREALGAAHAEYWTQLNYVDEDDDDAYRAWEEKMFVEDTDRCARLQSGMSDEQFLDAISAPRYESPTRRRKRAMRRKELVEMEEGGEGDGIGGEG